MAGTAHAKLLSAPVVVGLVAMLLVPVIIILVKVVLILKVLVSVKPLSPVLWAPSPVPSSRH